MFDNIENLKIISSLHRPNKHSGKIENRASHVFFIRVRGSVLYDFFGKNLTVNEGELIFLPKGSSYTYTCLSNDAIYTSINFQCDFAATPNPACYSFENFYDAEYLTYYFADMWNLGTQAEKYKCLSHFYNLLSYLSAVENSSYSEKKKFRIIEPAVNHLKENLYNSSLKTDKLHHLCGISNTYFRQIFVSNFGITPQEYITSKRLAHAKSIIDSGDFDTIAEVALSSGYNDPLYFSKAFKKMYGVSPSGLNKKEL